MNVFSTLMEGISPELTYLAEREIPDGDRSASSVVLSPDITVVDVYGPVDGDLLLREWPDRDFAQALQELMSGRDMERVLDTAARVVAASTGEFRAVPSRNGMSPFTVPTPGRELARFSTEPPPLALPAPRRRNFVSMTPLARRMHGLRRRLGNLGSLGL